MKIDLHTHCLPASQCALYHPELLPEMFSKKKIDAIVLTNHYYPYHCNALSPDIKEQARIYVDVYHRCKKKGDEIGVKVFLGAELKLINEPNKPEFLLYGLSEEVFLSSYPLYNKSQKELFDFCNETDVLMFQAHPYRIEQGYAPCDMRYVHGIEVYNPHPSFDARFDETLELANKHQKLKSAGTDFHIVDQAGLAGMVVPDYIEDQFMLRDYLRKGEAVIFNESEIVCC